MLFIKGCGWKIRHENKPLGLPDIRPAWLSAAVTSATFTLALLHGAGKQSRPGTWMPTHVIHQDHKHVYVPVSPASQYSHQNKMWLGSTKIQTCHHRMAGTRWRRCVCRPTFSWGSVCQTRSFWSLDKKQ